MEARFSQCPCATAPGRLLSPEAARPITDCTRHRRGPLKMFLIDDVVHCHVGRRMLEGDLGKYFPSL